MKKLFAIIAVAGFLTACNDSETKTDAKADSTANAMKADSSAMMNKMDTTMKKMDTTMKKMDTLMKK